MKKKFSKEFDQLVDFLNFTHEFREIVRVARSPKGGRFENDTEHSYQVAMMAWFLIENNKLKFDKERCLMYALAHDLVEVYAGDTYIYDKKQMSSKHQREKKALEKIKKRFPHFKNLIKIIEAYEKREDEESKFVYAIDKIIPPIQIYLEKGKLWHEKNVSFKELSDNKTEKIAISKEVNKYWQELFRELKKGRKKLFPN